jgi:hypothetical protein
MPSLAFKLGWVSSTIENPTIRVKLCLAINSFIDDTIAKIRDCGTYSLRLNLLVSTYF